MSLKNTFGFILAGTLFLPVGALAVSGDPGGIEPALKERPDVLFFSGYEAEPWDGAWGLAWGPSPSANASAVSGLSSFEGRSLQVHYLKNAVGPEGGLQYLMNFYKSSIQPRNSAHLRYYVKFADGFDFVRGGKLPGLAGGKGNTGGRKPDGTDGWSARIMWRPDGKITQYVYHPDQPGEYGEDFDWNYGGCPRYFTPGQWHCVETYVQMNKPGQKDGILRSWLDGAIALEIKTLRFREVETLQIDQMYFSTFFGGNDKSWAPPKEEYAFFDNFVIAEEYIGPNAKAPPTVPSPTFVPASTAIPAGALPVYDGEKQAWGESNWSEGQYDFAATTFNHTPGGKKSLRVQLPDKAWGGAQLAGPEIKAGKYRAISFWVYPTGCDVEFRVRLEEKGKQIGVEKAVTSASEWGMKANKWRRVEIPLADFKFSGNFDRIVFNSNSARSVSAFFLDDVFLEK
jgi:hypothetical protein